MKLKFHSQAITLR